MKSSIVLLGVIGLVVLVTTVSARPNHRESDLSTFDEESEVDNIGRNREHNQRGQRKRHSRQISNRYDYFSPSYYDLFRELFMIREQMNELADTFKDSYKSVPKSVGYQPQFIFIPIALPAFGSPCSCNNSNNVPPIRNRILTDVPQWGGSDQNILEDDDNDGGRPISFKPVNVNRPQRPLPPVEHGSVQAGLTPTTTKPPQKSLGACDAAILSCCRFTDSQQRECFTQFGCIKTYETHLACTDRAIQLVIQRFTDVYGRS